MARGDGVAGIGQIPVAVARAADDRVSPVHHILRRHAFLERVRVADGEDQDHAATIPRGSCRDRLASSSPTDNRAPCRSCRPWSTKNALASRGKFHAQARSCPCWPAAPRRCPSRPERRTIRRAAPRIMSAPSPAIATRRRPTRPPTRPRRRRAGPASRRRAASRSARRPARSRPGPPSRHATTQRRARAGASRRAGPPAAASGQRVNLRLAFETGSARLTPAATEQARVFGRALMLPQLANMRFRIEGHTDAVGSRAGNVALSQRRAQSVADFLIAMGVPRSRLDVQRLRPRPAAARHEPRQRRRTAASRRSGSPSPAERGTVPI